MPDITLTITPTTTPTESPFLPGTNIQFAWSSTTLSLLKECPRKYQYVVIEGWGSRDESIHLRFGQEYHSALQDYAIARAQGTPHEDAIRDTVQRLHRRVWNWLPDRSTRAGKYKNRDTILGLVIDYLDHFREDPAETFILGDGTPAVELSFRFELDWGPREGIDAATGSNLGAAQPYLLSGHLDRVVNFADGLYVMDRKTSLSTLSSYYFNQFSPSNQMSLYTLAGKIMLNSPIKGVIIDAAQVLLEKPNSSNGYWPQNDTSCDKFGGCKFREVCSRSPTVREAYLKATFDKLDPIETYNNPFFERKDR
jgi:hypothetical protein